MAAKKSKEDLPLKEITLSDNSNIILPEVSFPSTYPTQPVKLGAKSTEQKQASEHELLVYRQRISKIESTLTPQEIRNLVSETNERRKALEQSIAEQKEEFENRRNLEVQTRRIKEIEAAHQLRIKNENEEQRRKRLEAEEEVKTSRAREIQALENKRRKEKEEITVFFEQSSNRFTQKYCNPITQKKISEETGIDRIISSRHFSGTYSNRYAHRCVPCGYHFPESLSISKIYRHIYENKDTHMQYALDTIDNTYNVLIADTRKKHAAEDNHDLRQQKLSKELEQLQKLKGAKYR
jgi:DNA repair exonuclease SbcCD ATPase subunit